MSDLQPRRAAPVLPLEVLYMIVSQLEQDYVVSHSSGIFDVMRLSRLFRDMAFAAHFKKTDYRLTYAELSGLDQKELDNTQEEKWPSQEQIHLMLWDEHWARAWEIRPGLNK